MQSDAVGLGDQLRWSPSRPDTVRVDHDAAIVCGMGGSGMAAEATALAVDAPSTTHHGYGVPVVAARAPIVVAISYSGDTEETLDSVAMAQRAGFAVAAVTSGGRLAELAEERSWPLVTVPAGLQPRDALGYQVAAATTLIGAAFGQDVSTALAEAADAADEALDSAGRDLAADVADAIGRRVPAVFGTTGPGALAALRWKTQINENAKRPALAAELPEANHNDLQGWFGPDGGEGFATVMLRDAAADDRLRARLDLMTEMLADRVPSAGRIESSGVGPLARFFSLCAVGDLASLELARHGGVDPAPIDALDHFKTSLADRSPLGA